MELDLPKIDLPLCDFLFTRESLPKMRQPSSLSAILMIPKLYATLSATILFATIPLFAQSPTQSATPQFQDLPSAPATATIHAHSPSSS
jgi:hypothetical protein